MVALACAGGPPGGAGEAPAVLPPDALFESTCSSCHALDVVTALRLDAAGWEEVIRRMIEERGATWITDGETRILADHLAATYSPDAP